MTAEKKKMFLNSGMAVSTACKFDKLSPRIRPQQRCVSPLQKSRRVAQHPPRCDLSHHGILLVINIRRRQRLPAATGLLTVQLQSRLPELADMGVCWVGVLGADRFARAVGSKPPQILDSQRHVNFILRFLSLFINIADPPPPSLGAQSTSSQICTDVA